MSSIVKCCIKGCLSDNHNTILFEITKSINDFDKWIELMKPYLNFNPESVSENYIKRRSVCVRHFEKRFLAGAKRIPRAFPTLFTAEEILTGQPRITVQIDKSGSASQGHHDHDHNYSFLSRIVRVDMKQNTDKTQNEGQSRGYRGFDFIAKSKTDGSDETRNKVQRDGYRNLYTVHKNTKKCIIINDNNIVDSDIYAGSRREETDEIRKENTFFKAMAGLGAESGFAPPSSPEQYGIVTQVDENGEVLYEEIVDMDDIWDEEDLSHSPKSNKQNDATTKEQDCKILHQETRELEDLILLEEGPPCSEKSNTQNYEPTEDIASKSGPFSWNKKYGVVPQTDVDCRVLHEHTQDYDDLVMYEDNQPNSQKSDQHNDDTSKDIDDAREKQGHEGFQCNCCNNPIAGFRYCCVQCDDYDLCGACEARGAHARHYALRVPGPRPYEEVQSMLQLIRRQLYQSNVFLKPGDKSTIFTEDGIKLETKEEVEEVDPIDTSTQPVSVSPIFERGKELENIEEEAVDETDAESTTDLISENAPEVLTSVDQQTHITNELKSQCSDESDEELTTDLFSDTVTSTFLLTVRQPDCVESLTDVTSESNQIKLTLSNEPTSVRHKTETQDRNESDEESTTDLSPRDDVTELTWSHQPTRLPHKRKLNASFNSDEEPTTDLLPSQNVLTKPTLSYQPIHFLHKRNFQFSYD